MSRVHDALRKAAIEREKAAALAAASEQPASTASKIASKLASESTVPETEEAPVTASAETPIPANTVETPIPTPTAEFPAADAAAPALADSSIAPADIQPAAPVQPAAPKASEVPPPARVEVPPPTAPAGSDVRPVSYAPPPPPASKISAKTAAIANYAAAKNETRPPAPSTVPGHSALPNAAADLERLESVIQRAASSPFKPAADALIVSPQKPKDAPSEEFRSLRTRLNHLQSNQALHLLVVTSASPAEGKSFTACNLAMSQAQLNGKRILLADFDFRRPTIAKIFGLNDKPGLTDYLMGKAHIDELIHRIEGTNLYVIAAGESVTNPLELLNLTECRELLEGLRDHFDWVILDSPPLLFAADGNLLATMADGTILVVRIGTTTYDSVTRAMQSLCENNVLGIVVNGAHHGELYSRYSYYQSYYYGTDRKQEPKAEEAFQLETVGSRKD